MKYKYNDNTLIHAIGFNPMKLEGILKFGIVSENYAESHCIPYAKNYNFTLDKDMLDKISSDKNTNDIIEGANKNNIYLVRSLYISDDSLSAYNMYVKHGISFIVEDIDFIYDKNKELIKRSDEVVVKEHVPLDCIKAIMIPDEYKDKKLNEVNIFPTNILNYNLIKTNIIGLIKYLGNYNCFVELDDIAYLLKDLNTAYLSVISLDKNNPEYQEALNDYKEIVKEIDFMFRGYVYETFSNLLDRKATVLDMVEYINNKYSNKPITYLEGKGKTR